MSAPSFQLSRKGDRWIATAAVGFKKPVQIDCGDGSKKSAEEIARREVKRKHQLAEAGRIRWRKFRAEKANAGKVARATAGEPQRATIDQPTTEDPPGEAFESEPAPAPPDPSPSAPAPAASSPERAAEIAGRLRALGAGDRPIEPDAVHAPGADYGADDAGGDPEDPPLDDEAGELLGDLLAAVAVSGHMKLIAKLLRKRRPPMQPGDAPDKFVEWERDGLAYNIKRLVGGQTRLGPTGKMFIGAGIITLAMVAGAEPIEAAAGTAPPPSSSSSSSPPAATAAAAADTAAEEEPTPATPAQNPVALGRFS